MISSEPILDYVNSANYFIAWKIISYKTADITHTSTQHSALQAPVIFSSWVIVLANEQPLIK